MKHGKQSTAQKQKENAWPQNHPGSKSEKIDAPLIRPDSLDKIRDLEKKVDVKTVLTDPD